MDEIYKDSHFILQKGTNSQNKHFSVQEICTHLCGKLDVWITVRL